MNSSYDKKRTNVVDDRLSTLPNDLIHKILSFIGMKDVIQTSVLSSRWRFLWTSMPYLNLSQDDFSRRTKLSEFVTHVLSGRNSQIDVTSISLSFRSEGCDVVEKIMKYAFSHNIKQLNVSCVLDKAVEFPLFLFSSQSLKHLRLTKHVFPGYGRYSSYFLKDTSTLEFPVLTTMYLHHVNLCCEGENVGFFSKCVNLKDLTLKDCYTEGFKGLSICLPLLSNLTFEDIRGSVRFVNMDAPQLKYLSIKTFYEDNHQYVISAPALAVLLYKGHHCLQFSTNGFLSLEKADICVSWPFDAHQIVSLLQHLHSVKFLTLNLEIVERLSSSEELMSHQSSPFANLKGLKIHPVEERVQNQTKMSTDVEKYLLGSSPGASVTMVSREEVMAMKDTKFAQELMTELQVLLNQEKSKNHTETRTTKRHEQGMVEIGKHINRCWKYFDVQIEKEQEKASDIIYKLSDIRAWMVRLPPSNRAMIQPSFSTLCAEAETVVSGITDRMKMRCDESYNRLTVCFQQLAITSDPSP